MTRDHADDVQRSLAVLWEGLNDLKATATSGVDYAEFHALQCVVQGVESDLSADGYIYVDGDDDEQAQNEAPVPEGGG